MSAAADYSPLEILLLFQSLVKFGTEPSTFNKISDLLGTNEVIKETNLSDLGRLRPDALRGLYTNLVAEEKKEASAGDHNDRRSPSLHEPAKQGGSSDGSFLPRLVERLYARYKESVVKGIREDESRFRVLRCDINEIERGRRDGDPQIHGSTVSQQRPTLAPPPPTPELKEPAHLTAPKSSHRLSPGRESSFRPSPTASSAAKGSPRSGEDHHPGNESVVQAEEAKSDQPRSPMIPQQRTNQSLNGADTPPTSRTPLSHTTNLVPRPIRPTEATVIGRSTASSLNPIPAASAHLTASDLMPKGVGQTSSTTQQRPGSTASTPVATAPQHGVASPLGDRSPATVVGVSSRPGSSLVSELPSTAGPGLQDSAREPSLRPLARVSSPQPPAPGLSPLPSYSPQIPSTQRPSSSAPSPLKSVATTPGLPTASGAVGVGTPTPILPPPALSQQTPVLGRPTSNVTPTSAPPFQLPTNPQSLAQNAEPPTRQAGVGGGGSSLKSNPYASPYDPGQRSLVESAPQTPKPPTGSDRRGNRPTPLNTSASSTRWKSSMNDRPLETPRSPLRPPPSPLSDVDSPQWSRPRRTANGQQRRKVEGKESRETSEAPPTTRRGTRRSIASMPTRSRRGGSIASTLSQQSTEPRTRSESVVADADDPHAAAKVKPEPPSTPAPFHTDGDTEMGGDTADEAGRPHVRRGRSTAKAGQSPANLKRKRNASINETSDAGDDTGLDPRIPMLPTGPRYIQCTPNFSRTTAPVFNDITGHKYANIFQNPVKVKDAPNYSELIYQPQDLKSIKAAITAGGRAVAAAAAASAVGTPAEVTGSPATGNSTPSKNASLLLAPSPEVMPPKGIVNSAHFERELMRMFANAVMFNHDPNRGFGPAFKERRDGHAGASDDSLLGNNMEEDGGVVKDTREMFEAVEKTITDWRAAERGRKPRQT